jgi:hypothetical protein
MPDIEQTRREIRDEFYKWEVKPENYSIAWEDKGVEGRNVRYPYGVRVQYFRNGIKQEVSCLNYGIKNDNLRQCMYLIQRLRISEKHGVQYHGLTYSKEIVASSSVDAEKQRREDLLDAYDILGGSPDDPTDLIKELYRKKSMFYHPDKGGSAEKFKRLTDAYNLILGNRGQH